MKRILVLLLVLCLLTGSVCGEAGYNEEDDRNFALLIGEFSEQSFGTAYYGMMEQGNFYLDVKQLCQLLHGAYDDDLMEFSVNDGQRSFDIYAERYYGPQTLLERCAEPKLFQKGTVDTAVPVKNVRGTSMISLLHFLEYIGMGYVMDECAVTPQLMLLPVYTVYDAVQEMYALGLDTPFDWHALAVDDKTLENMQSAALIGEILSNHPLEAILPGSREMELYVKDTLIRILQMRGVGEDALYEDWTKVPAYLGKTGSFSCTVLSEMFELCELGGKATDYLITGVNGIEKLQAYGKIGQAEKTLLADTLLSIYGDYSSEIAQKPELRSAAAEIHENLSSRESFMGAVYEETVIPMLLDSLSSLFIQGKGALELLDLMHSAAEFTSDSLEIGYEAVSAPEKLAVAFVAGAFARAARDIRLTAENIKEDPAYVLASDADRRKSMDILKAAIILQCKAEMLTIEQARAAGVMTAEEDAYYARRWQDACNMLNKAAMAQIVYPHYYEEEPLSMQWMDDYMTLLQGEWMPDADSLEQLGGKNVTFVIDEHMISCTLDGEKLGNESFVLCGPQLFVNGETLWMNFVTDDEILLQGQFDDITLTWEKNEPEEDGGWWYGGYIDAFYQRADREGRYWDDLLNDFTTSYVQVNNGVMTGLGGCKAMLDNSIKPDALDVLDLVAWPDRINKKFHTIGTNAFADYTIHHLLLKVDLGVETIESGAFTGQQMQLVQLSDPLARLEEGAFTDCPLLWAIEFPGEYTHMTSRAIVDCEALRYVVIPPTVKEIADDFISSDTLHQLTVFGYPGSEAESYALRNGLGFIDMTAPDAFDRIKRP